MKITLPSDHLQSGENLSRTLKIEIQDEYASKEIRLSFISPLGRNYVSNKLSFTDNRCDYLIPGKLLDGRGTLYVQLIVFDGDKYLCKSSVYEFPVYRSVDENDVESSDGSEIKSTAEIYSELSRKADILHIHDDRYYKKEDTDKKLDEKVDIRDVDRLAYTGEYADIRNKPDIPEIPQGVSAFANDMNYISSDALFDAEFVNSVSLGRQKNSFPAEGSAVFGEGLIAENRNQLAVGRYNTDDNNADYAVIVGGGTKDDARNNVHTIKWNGEGWFAGKLKCGGTGSSDKNAKELATTEYVDNENAKKQDKLTVDSSVTENSVNPVSSGAVFDAIKKIPASKGNVISVNGKTGEVNLSASDVGALSDTVKIPQVPSDVSAFRNDAGYLTEHQSLEGLIDKNTFEQTLSGKADLSYTENQLELKEDKTSVDSKLALKEDITSVDSKLALKEDISSVDSKLALKEDKTSVDSKLALKDDITSVDSKLALKAPLEHTHSLSQIEDLSLGVKNDSMNVKVGIGSDGNLYADDSFFVVKGSVSIKNKKVSLPDKSVFQMSEAIKKGKTVIYDGVYSDPGPFKDSIHMYFRCVESTELFSIPYIMFAGVISSNGLVHLINSDTLVHFVITYLDNDGIETVSNCKFLDISSLAPKSSLPVNLSELKNDMNFIDSSSLMGLASESYVDNSVKNERLPFFIKCRISASENIFSAEKTAETPDAGQVDAAYEASRPIFLTDEAKGIKLPLMCRSVFDGKSVYTFIVIKGIYMSEINYCFDMFMNSSVVYSEGPYKFSVASSAPQNAADNLITFVV